MLAAWLTAVKAAFRKAGDGVLRVNVVR